MADDYLEESRKEIDKIDEKILDLLGKRARIVTGLWLKKNERDDNLVDESRENAIWATLTKGARARGLPVEPILRIYDQVIGMTLSDE